MRVPHLARAVKHGLREALSYQEGDGDARRFYLVASAGAPNFGDEFITRSWLDWLTENHPTAEVWLDCLHPGRATHLFRDTHPRLRVTNTLWQLAHTEPLNDLRADQQRAERLVSKLGSPQFDLGLEDLRGMSSIHFLGGGYLNEIWSTNLTMVAAAAEVRRRFGVSLYATGLGLMPSSDKTREFLSTAFEVFDYVEARDEPSARAHGIAAGSDDAFLGFATNRRIFGEYEVPDRMILVQGDFVNELRREGVRQRVEEIVRAISPGRVGFVEAYPPRDADFVPSIESSDNVEFFPFMRIWQEGLPVSPTQEWATSRFHLHLLAAAGGASGTAIVADEGYYDVKHDSLAAVGTGWNVSSVDDWISGRDSAATRDETFAAEKVPALARRKAEIGHLLYG